MKTSPSPFVRHRPVAMGHRGMVAAAHPLASLAGLDVLRHGGNAIDAAIATNAALNVTQPGMCGIGGDLFALVYSAREGRVRFLNGSGRTPAATDPAEIVQSQGSLMPERGIRTVTVPGCVDAWFTLHREYGSRPVGELLAPAVQLAREGFPISHLMVDAITKTAGRLRPHQSWRDVYAPDGRVPKPGERFCQAELAGTLELICAYGRDAFYAGPIAEAIVHLSDELGGWFSLEDLADHRSNWADPIQTTYRGYTIFETPPNTQGMAALIGLNVMEGRPADEWEWSDPNRLHHHVEAKKLAFVERDRYVADPECYRAPLGHLLSKEHADGLRARINRERAAETGVSPPHAGGTTYFAVADDEGNLVSCVQSLYKGFGALVAPAGTGISLHNRGAYFSLDPGHPNVLQPRKRPFHTLMAALAFREENPVLVFGSMGGDGQPQTHMQVFSNIFDYGMDIQQAIEAPRWAHDVREPQDPPGRLLLEARFGAGVAEALGALGHPVDPVGGWDGRMGHAQGIWVAEDVYMGGADPRGDGCALGW